VRVAAVDDHVARLEQRCELVDHRVGGSARLHHDHEAAWPLQARHELLRGLRRQEGAFVAELLDQLLGPAVRTVVHRHGMAVPRQVSREVAAHDRQPRDPDARQLRH
jgi:hypothetical protein